jgi:hypothetical protein
MLLDSSYGPDEGFAVHRLRVKMTAFASLAAVALPARAEIVNPGVMVGGYLFTPWGIAASVLLGWPAVRFVTGRSWAQSVRPTLVVKAPSALLGPFLLWLTGGFILSFAPFALAANVVASTALYALLDLGALYLGLKTKPTLRGATVLFAANLVLIAAAMILFVTVDRDKWLRIRSYLGQ